VAAGRPGASIEVVLRLLQGEDLDTFSPQLGVASPTLAHWRNRYLTRGRPQSLAARPTRAPAGWNGCALWPGH
jgi:hypothetical protein